MESLDALVLYALLTTALYYLGARAAVTSWLWSRYPTKLAHFMDCAACSGFWYGVLVAAVLPRNLVSIPGGSWYALPLVGLCSMVWTPIVAAVMKLAFDANGTAVPEVEIAPPKPSEPPQPGWTAVP